MQPTAGHDVRTDPGTTRGTGRDRWARIPPTAIVLIPVCILFLFGLAWRLPEHKALFDDRLFISVGHGVLSHGYPFETFHTPAGLPFFDHTPLFSYFLTVPAIVDSLFGFEAGVLTGRAISAVFGLATVILTYYVCRDVRGTVSGVVAAVLLATNAYFVRLSWIMHMEVPMAFFLVLGLYLLVHRRMLWAGVAIAVAVMLKEHALGFWLVAGVYVLLLHGWRAALKVAVPSVVAFVAWGIVANQISHHQLEVVLNRWLNSAGGESTVNRRFHVRLRAWIRTIAATIVGLPLGGMTLVAMGVALVRRRPVPAIAAVPLAYAALAIGSSFLIHLKEERWLTAVVPMLAIAVGMLVDWGAVARWLTLRDVRGRVDEDALGA